MITLLDENGMWTSDGSWLPALDKFRIPIQYLSAMFAAGNTNEVKRSLSRLLALRQYRRQQEVDGVTNIEILEQVGLNKKEADHMYRLLSLAFLNERFVIPTTRREDSDSDPFIERGFTGFDEMSPLADMKRRQRFHADPHSDEKVEQVGGDGK